MAHAINSDTLKALRQKRDWTQKQLAERLKCSSDQVSRWERGISQNVRSHLRKALEKTFRVEWEELTKPPQDSDKSADDSFDVQLNVRVSHSQRMALHWVGLYYRIPTARVIGLAPLLFLIIAEKSLAQRRAALSEIESMLEHAETEGRKIARHLDSDLGVAYTLADNALVSESESIEKCDLFGDLVELEYVSASDEQDLNPFANYLKKLAEEIPEGMVTELSADWGSRHISYTVLEDDLRRVLVPLAKDGNEDQAQMAFNQILDGGISLKQAFAKRKILSDPEFRDWLLAESQNVLEEHPLNGLAQGFTAEDGAE